MSRRLALAALALALAYPAAARAQTGCSVLPQASLLAPFADNVAAGSITPSAVRNAICSALNPLNNLGDLTNPALGLSNLGGLAPSGVLSGSPNVVVTPNVGARTATVGTTNPINFQGGATYSVQATDAGQEVEMTDASSATAVTLPQAGTAGFTSGFVATVCALTQPSTVAAAVGTVNGLASLALQPFQCADLRSNGTRWLAAASAGLASASQVANTTALRAASTATYPNGVVRLTDGVAGAPPLFFAPAPGGACSADDGGHCVAAAGGGYWLAQFSGPADVREWGGVLDGSTDAGPAIDACLASVIVCLVPPSALGAGITTPVTVGAGHYLVGTYFASNNTLSPSGSFLACADQVFMCVTLTGNGNGVRDLGILGTGNPPAAGEVGLYVDATFDSQVENVTVFNHDTCMSMFGQTGTGIYTVISNPLVAKCATHYWKTDGYPAVEVIGGRTGSNGATDYATANEYIYATNSACNSGGCGPNALYFVNHIFNPGGIAGRPCFLSFANFTGTSPGNQDWKFISDHVEDIALTGAAICSDSTIANVQQIDFVGTDLVGAGGSPNMFNIASSTAVSGINISGGCVGLAVAMTPSSTVWKNIYISNDQCPIDLTIAPSGTSIVEQIGISHTQIGAFDWAPTSSSRSHGISISDSTVTASFTADWSGEGSGALSSFSLTGSGVTVPATFNGGSTDGIISLSGDNFASTVTLSGAFYSFNGAGNVMTGAITDTATGSIYLNDPRGGLVTSGAGAASKYVCVDANGKMLTQSAAC